MTTALEKQRDIDIALQDIQFRENETAREEQTAKALADAISPPGAIPNISPILEYRRLRFNIPDMMFSAAACNNKVNVFQIPSPGSGSDTFVEGGLLVKPGFVKKRELQAAPKGIVVSAGLNALDSMYTNGYWPGHVINFIHQQPYHKPVGTIDGIDQFVLCMTAGDITDSDDLANYMRSGWVKISRREFTIEDGDNEGMTGVEHYYEDVRDGDSGRVWDPSTVQDLLEVEENQS